MKRSACSIVFALFAAVLGCAEQGSEEEAAPAEPSQTAPKAPPPHGGPLMPIMAGEGVGAIRLGANVHTIERLMGKPCEILTDSLCRYVDGGVDFHLVNAHLGWIHVQRSGRPAGRDMFGDPIEFGFFRGAIPPDIRLGMVPSAVQEALGKPYRVEKLPQPNPTTLLERHYYPGLVIEYDRYTNGNMILGGVRVVKKDG